MIPYHYVVEGVFHLRLEGEDGEGLVLGPGEVVILPRNDVHLMGSDLSLPPAVGSDIIRPPQDGGLFSINHGGAGARTRMVCGFLGCDRVDGNPVLSTLPPLLKRTCRQDYANTSRRPGIFRQGLEKKYERTGQLPPGLQKRFECGQTLPADYSPYLYPVPNVAYERVGPLPPDSKMYLYGNDLILLNDRTKAIIDILRGAYRHPNSSASLVDDSTVQGNQK